MALCDESSLTPFPMRGFPPLHLVIFAIGFALLAVPLSRLTFARPTVVREAAPLPADAAAVPAIIRIRVAHVPDSLSLKVNGRELVVGADPKLTAATLELRENLSIPAEGLEFLVSAKWPAGTPDTALSVELEPEGLDAQSQTRWSSGAQMDDVIVYHWKP